MLNLNKRRLKLLLTTVSLCCLTGAQADIADDTDVVESTPATVPSESSETAMSVEEILSRDPTDAEYAEQTRCINTGRIRNVEVIDSKHVSFRMSKDSYYLVRFKYRCPGLRPKNPIIYEKSAAQRLCVHDTIQGTNQHGLGNFTPGVRCAIGGFESVTKEQIVMLKDALKAAKRKKRAS